MKKIAFLHKILFIALVLTSFRGFSQCFEIETILVDACSATSPTNDEGFNEMVRFRVGPAPLNTSTLSVNWPSNAWTGLIQNGVTATKVATINASIIAAGNCGLVVEPVGGVLPANAEVLLVTSQNFTVNLNSFNSLTSTLYIIFQNNTTTTGGHFGNYNVTPGTRTLSMTFGAGCTDSVTYERSNLININGGSGGTSAEQDGASVNFTPAGVPSYVNTGCTAPVTPFTVSASASPTACVAPGAVVTLTGVAQGYQSVAWTSTNGAVPNPNNLNTTYTVPATATGTITFTLTATNTCGSTITSSVSISVGAASPPTVLPVTYCQNATAAPLTATAATGATLNWYGTNATGGTASSTAPTPLTTGAPGSVVHYYVSQTVNGCESARADLAVYIGRGPVAGDNPFLFCDGANTTTTQVAFDFNNVRYQTGPDLYQTSWGYSYSINGGTPVTGTHTGLSHFNVPVTAAGSAVTFTITWNGICTPSQTVTCYASCLVTPVLSIHNPAAVCAPNTVDITQPAVTAGSTGGGTLTYWTNSTATTALSNPAAISVGGTYYIKSSVGNCSDIKPVVVTINPNPSLTITNPAAVCAPNTVNITAPAVTAGSTGGGTLSYWFDSAATIGISNPSTIAASGTYYIKSTAGTCTDIKPVVVTINPNPSLTITNPAAVCTPSTVDITAPAITAGSTGSGTLTYWTNAAATTSLSNPTTISASGTYYIKSTVGTCTDIKPVVVTITTTPVLTITNPAAVCAPTTVNITLPAVTAGSTGGGTLSYWTNAAATNALSNPAAITASGTYYIKSTVGTCSDIKPVTVAVNPTPSLTITNPSAVCSPSTVNITLPAVTVGSTGGGTLTYWTNAAATTALSNPTTISVSGTYYIKSTLGSCFDIKPVTVSIGTTPSLTITDPAAVCAPNTVDITLPAVTAGSTGGGTLTYWFNATATLGISNPTAIAASGRYYIKSTVGSCTDIKVVNVTINPTPVLSITDPAAVCAPATVNITLPAVTAGSTGAGTLTYWTNAAATATLSNPTAIAVSGTYYIKSTIGTCTDIKPVVVTINAAPVLTITNPAAVCSPNSVDITAPSVTAGSTAGTTLTYWTNAAATTTLSSPNAITTSGTYYIKSTLGSCSDIKPVTVTINPTPALSIHNPAPACSPNTVNLTLPAVTAGSTGSGTLTYWTNATATTALANPATISVSGTYYIKSTSGSCFDIEPVIVTISSPNLVITNPAGVCAPATVNITAPAVTAGSTGGGTLSYWFDAAATIGISNPSTIAASGTYYIKSTIGTCSDIKPVVVSITSGFTVNEPQPLKGCDPSHDGFIPFDLTQVINGVTGGNATYSVSFHETSVDATRGATPIQFPANYTNINPWLQTIYIRVSSSTSTCYEVVPLQLIVNDTPQARVPQAYAICDMTGLDHYETFDLTTRIPEILGSINPTLTNVYFYEQQSDALVNNTANAIVSVGGYTNTVPDQQTIYVVVQTRATGCFDVVELHLVVSPLPISQQPNYLPYSVCDNNRNRIGYEVFNLADQIASIQAQNGQTGMNITFHLTQADAVRGTPSLPLSYENVRQFVQTIWVRITNPATTCYSISTMDLRVEPLPTLVPQASPYTICDDNPDGISCGFDLSTLIPTLLQGANYTLSFYETIVDAQQGNVINVIDHTQPYCNSIPFVQQLYVRAVDNITGCVSVTQIELNVDPSPVSPVQLSDIVVCDYDSNTQDQQTLVDLTQKNAAILAQQPLAASNYAITYHGSSSDAQQGTGQLIPFASHLGHTNDTIWVRVENIHTHCYSIGSFHLIINAPLLLTTPAALSLCDDDASPNDQHHAFDLTIKNSEITQNLTGYTVTYYPSLADAQNHRNAISDANATAYVNVPPAVQTLGVVVTSPAPASCQSITTLDIRVLPIPTPRTNPTALPPQCDYNNPGDMLEYFDLTTNEGYIANGDRNLRFHYFRTQAEAEAGNLANEITPANRALVGQDVWIRVENTLVDYQGNHCYVVIRQALKVNPLPTVAQNLDPFRACDNDADGFTVFNLADPTLAPRILGTSQSTADYTVAYYQTAAGADPTTNTGELALPSSYTNTTAFNQTIYIRVTNNTTGCSNATGQLNLVVEDYATATSPATFRQCDNGVNNTSTSDGRDEIDLNQFNAAVLNGQNPAVFLVSYYIVDPTTNPNAVALSSNEAQHFMAGPTTRVWAKVENSSNTIRPLCSAVAPVDIVIEPRPNADIKTANGVTTICVRYTDDQVLRTLTLDTGITNPGNYIFEWFQDGSTTAIAGATGPTYTVDTPSAGAAPRTYIVHITNNFAGTLGCDSYSRAFTVVQSGPAVVAAGAQPGYVISNAFSDPQSITVNVVGYGDYWYSLDDGPRQQSNVFDNVSFDPHIIHVWDMTDGVANSCDEFTIQFATPIDYPHYFTPNGDGINDTWFIRGLKDMQGVRLYIFDRYGKLLKQLSASGPGWDGTYNGHMLPADDYWFTVEFTEPNTSAQTLFKAHFTLKR